MKTINGIEYETFREACHAAGYLKEDSQWKECLKEAVQTAFPRQLRSLFCFIVAHNTLSNPTEIWTMPIAYHATDESDKEYLPFWRFMCEDYSHANPDISLSDLEDYCLLEIEKILVRMVNLDYNDAEDYNRRY